MSMTDVEYWFKRIQGLRFSAPENDAPARALAEDIVDAISEAAESKPGGTERA